MPVVDVAPLAEPVLGRGHPRKVAYPSRMPSGDCSLKMEFLVLILFYSGSGRFV